MTNKSVSNIEDEHLDDLEFFTITSNGKATPMIRVGMAASQIVLWDCE